LVPPPRLVPVGTSLRVLFGGFLNQFGWFFFGFGLIFVWAMFPTAAWEWYFCALGGTETAAGVVTESWETGGSVNDVPVYAVSYRFSTPDGIECEDFSFQTRRDPYEGTDVTIEYAKGRPSVSRIQGMRRSTFGLGVSFVVVFPLIGLCFMIVGLRKGLRASRLLRRGKPGFGTLVSKEATATEINEQTVYKLTFEFTADDGETYTAVAKTHLPESLEDEEQERLLYDPRDPSCAVLLDNLPGGPRVDGTGNLQAAPIGGTLVVLVLPAASVIGHGAYLFTHYFR